MAKTELINVNDLSIDLNNYRTPPQKDEISAIRAMISVKPEKFYGVMESLIHDGYLLTENIIVFNHDNQLIVREGNRRVASLKLIHGIYDASDFDIPENIIEQVKEITETWKAENLLIPCTVFSPDESSTVNKIVKLAHGKGEKASRDPWTSVARARHNRDENKASEPALDLLEKYLTVGRNINNQQKERWAGDYPLTVLSDAMRKIFPRLSYSNAIDLANNYPKLKFLVQLEDVLLNIGLEQIRFETVRNTDFPTNYGIPPLPTTQNTSQPNTQPVVSTNSSTSQNNINSTQSNPNPTTTVSSPTPSNSTNNPPTQPTPAPTPTPTPKPKPTSYATNDPKHVKQLLKNFSPKGSNRQKVITLRNEIRKLKVEDNPLAFCFILRSLFEISAGIFCAENNIPTQDANGKPKQLKALLNAVTNHLTNNSANIGKMKTLHGAITELSKPEGLLSVTSMNQLVHNPTFSISPHDICTLFGNVYPLLEEIN